MDAKKLESLTALITNGLYSFATDSGIKKENEKKGISFKRLYSNTIMEHCLKLMSEGCKLVIRYDLNLTDKIDSISLHSQYLFVG